jgi:hypothetical protein
MKAAILTAINASVRKFLSSGFLRRVVWYKSIEALKESAVFSFKA